MRSRSSEVGVGLVVAKGHVGLTIKDECKPIPVEGKKRKENARRKHQPAHAKLARLGVPRLN